MKKWGIVLGALFLLVGLVITLVIQARPTTAQTIDQVFASPVNAGCYIAGPNQCKIHVDPFTINIDNVSGKHLETFTMYANGNPIYEFSTDVSNPPTYDYYVMPVALDLAATCGQTYVLNYTVKTADFPNPLNTGQTRPFTCPLNMP